MNLNSNRILFSLLDKWRGNSAYLSFDGEKVTARGKQVLAIAMSDIDNAPVIEQKWLGSELSFTAQSGLRKLRIRDGNNANLTRFSNEVEKAWREFNTEQLQSKSDVIRSVVSKLEKLYTPLRFPSACLFNPSLTLAGNPPFLMGSSRRIQAVKDLDFRRQLTFAAPAQGSYV